MYADKAKVAEGEEKKIWLIKLQIENGYLLMGDLTDPPYPFKAWLWAEKKAMGHGIKFIDASQNYKDTMAVTQININIGWEGKADTGKDVEWLNLSREIWYLCNIAKNYGGLWSPALKQWLSISVEALPKLLQTKPWRVHPGRHVQVEPASGGDCSQGLSSRMTRQPIQD
eukprot:475891-Rhodomonas_salina.1